MFARLEAASVPAGPIYSVRDMAEDAHYAARGMFERVEVDGRSLAVPAIAPKLAGTPGRTDFAGPALGAHNRDVFCGLLGLDEHELDALAAAGVI